MKDGAFTIKEKKRYRSKGYVIHHCWKCGGEYIGSDKGTYLPARKEYRHICRKCKQMMEL